MINLVKSGLGAAEEDKSGVENKYTREKRKIDEGANKGRSQLLTHHGLR